MSWWCEKNRLKNSYNFGNIFKQIQSKKFIAFPSNYISKIIYPKSNLKYIQNQILNFNSITPINKFLIKFDGFSEIIILVKLLSLIGNCKHNG